jgi:nucleotide-binding universal stress UspA family protein
MFEHILVPLDGSSLAEAALAPAAYLARVLGAKVTLLHIVEKDAPATVHGERHLTGTRDAEAYLDEIARRLFPAETPLERHVHTTKTHDVAEGIVVHEGEFAPDLIVMCTHGRHGVRRFVLGSMAEKVVASGRTPVLLIRPGPSAAPKAATANGAAPKAAPNAFQCRLILVPVDGDPVHERGLDIAVGLAAAAGATVRVLSVVPTPSKLSGRHATTERFMPSTTRAALELTLENLKSYQQHHLSRIQALGVATSGEVKQGDTASVIAETAEGCDADVIVIATHGSKGAKAFWAHSVGAKVQARTSRPLLLVPVRRSPEGS